MVSDWLNAGLVLSSHNTIVLPLPLSLDTSGYMSISWNPRLRATLEHDKVRDVDLMISNIIALALNPNKLDLLPDLVQSSTRCSSFH